MIQKVLVTLFFLIPVFVYSQVSLHNKQRDLLQTRIDSLTITHYLLNEPEDKNFNRKFKVLEFWATWCKPCLKAVPHINKMQEKFRDSNIVFFSFTKEPPEVARKVFNKVSFKTITVADTTAIIHQQLGILSDGTMGLPRTVLIDDTNTIVWFGSPDQLSEKLLLRFLRREL